LLGHRYRAGERHRHGERLAVGGDCTGSAGAVRREIVAYNDAGTATSNTATAITYFTAPTAPSALSVSKSGADDVLAWTDNSTNEDMFKVERSTDNVSFSQIATTTLNLSGSASYTDAGSSGTLYYYRVRAYNTLGNSGYSTSASIITVITVSGDITSSTTWQPVNIYVVTAPLTVDAGVTLTINPGTIVKFGTSSVTRLIVDGTLDAQGASTSTIYFTSINDDEHGGAVSGSSGSPGFGDWDRIKTDSTGSSTIT
jgi:hypothetical protein